MAEMVLNAAQRSLNTRIKDPSVVSRTLWGVFQNQVAEDAAGTESSAMFAS